MKRCIFLDRDGVVNVSPGPERYVTRWEDFRFEPGFVSVLRRVRESGFEAVVVTNQRCVALGQMSVEELEDIHVRFRQTLRADHGLDVTDVFYCPHDRDACACRKPAPGMLVAAARKHGLDLAASWMIGDSPTDIEAGRAAGCRTILVGNGDSDCIPTVRAVSMAELDSLIAEGRLVL